MDTGSISLLAWTTTPWTLPANMFAAVHNDILYAVVFMKEEQQYYIVAKSLL
jgi:isoleucyl-tRNA synthetase